MTTTFDINKRASVSRFWCGLTSCQVCAKKDATDKEILDAANSENTSGTTNGWVKVLRTKEDLGSIEETALPGQCLDHPDRMHFIVIC